LVFSISAIVAMQPSRVCNSSGRVTIERGAGAKKSKSYALFCY
jgi:hypothetical protein